MKKGLLTLGALVALGLASCGEAPAKDTVNPIISGNKDVTTTVSESINLLDGISANDDVDGDLTSKVTVTVMPELTVSNGSVTPTAAGSYEVAYKVTDKAGNVGEAFATLTVNQKLADKVEYKKYTFGQSDDSPFGAFVFEGLNVSNGISKGNYVVAGQSDGEAGHIKFEGKTKTVKNAEYTVAYELTSNVQGNVTFEAYGIPANKTVEIKEGYNKVKFTFTAVEDKDEQGFCLQLGALPTDFEVAVSKIEITQAIGEDVWATLNPNFKFNKENAVTTVFDNNSEGSLVTTEEKAVMNITKGSDENGVWQSKLFVKAGVDLEKDTKYRISVDFLSQKDLEQFEVCYNNGDNEKGIGALYGQKAVANEKKTIELIVTPDANKDDLVLLFQVGHQNVVHDSNVIEVSNLKVEKIVTEDTVVLENHVFTSENLYGHFWSESQGTLAPSEDGSKAVLTVTKGTNTPNVWEIWAGLTVGDLEGGRTYEVSVDVKSSIALDKAEALLRKTGTEENLGGDSKLALEANQTKTVKFTANVANNVNAGITFQLGAIQEAAVVEFSNLKITALGGSKETQTEGYVFTPEGFGTYNEPGEGEGFLYIEDGKLVYEMTKIALTDWHNKLYISRLNLEADKIYTIEVVAKADKNISCAFFLNPCGKWEPRVSQEMAFTTSEQTYSFVTPKFAADMDFEVLFQFGSDVNHALGGAKIEISSIIIYSQDMA